MAAARATTAELKEELRRRAEIQLNRLVCRSLPDLPPENVERLVHELRVHQIELEMQCHELARTRGEAEESRDNYRELYESIPIGYATVDAAGRLLDINQAGAALLQLEKNRTPLPPFFSFFAEGPALDVARFCLTVLDQRDLAVAEFAMKRSNGSRFEAVLQAVPVQTGEGKGERLRIAFQDITDRKEAQATARKHEAELEDRRNELQSLTEKLMGAQELERKRIACDIHDDYCQRLTALILESRSLVRLCDPHKPVAARLTGMSERLKGMLSDFRDLSHALHPRHLETLTLSGSMRQLVEDYSHRDGFQVELVERDVPAKLLPSVAICLFRVLQESLSNIAKHAQASAVLVTLTGTPDAMQLNVKDDGKGFDRDRKDEKRQGIGLVSMQERVRALGGSIHIDSRPQQGTAVAITIPVVHPPAA